MTEAENLLQIKEHPRDRHLFGPGPKRVLSLDGGGVRGAISVAFLQRIENIFAAHQKKILRDYIAARESAGTIDETVVAARKKLRENFRLADWFDLVGGTSTGALIAGALSLGYNTEHIKTFYTKRASSVFQRSPIWQRIPLLHAKFDATARRQEIGRIVDQRTLDSDDLITGLCIVTKRMDTGSPWILSNNPRAPYWESRPPNPDTNEPGHIGNRYYKLAALVRASTAAPHYFDPEIIRIIGDGIGVSNPDPITHGMFVDGGVTPYNNPSIALLMQVVLKPLNICWALGPDKLTFVSIGTGSYRTKLSFTDLGIAPPLKLAYELLMSMMGDTQTLALAQMQWLGECPDPWLINTEIGDLGSEMPPGRRWFRFMRYDMQLEPQWLKSALGEELDEAVVAGYRNMDDPAIIEPIYELAQIAAERQVKVEHFFPLKASDA